MAGYLRKYVGIYEVRADYDLDTNDFPRTIDGTLEPSFDDYYINCQNGIKIRHATGSTLSCYVPSVKRGKDILRVLEDIVIEFDVLDGEVYFTFPSKEIEKVVKLCKVKTKGKNIQPLSPKTLPKKKNIVPKGEMAKYKDLVDKIEGETPLERGMVVKEINKNFARTLPKSWKKDCKKELIDFHSYIYKLDKWEKYISYLEKKINAN